MSTTDSHVPAEFRGLARLFRDKIVGFSDAATPRLRKIARQSEHDCRRGYGGMRLERVLPDVERKWRAVAGTDRLDLTVRSTSTKLAIEDTRLIRSNISEVPNWGNVDEPALVITCAQIDIQLGNPRHCRWSGAAMATINLHALGRFFERAARDDDVLLANLKLLAEAHPALIDQPGPFALAVTGGEWRGMVGTLKEPDGRLTVCIHARTFVAA